MRTARPVRVTHQITRGTPTARTPDIFPHREYSSDRPGAINHCQQWRRDLEASYPTLKQSMTELYPIPIKCAFFVSPSYLSSKLVLAGLLRAAIPNLAKFVCGPSPAPNGIGWVRWGPRRGAIGTAGGGLCDLTGARTTRRKRGRCRGVTSWRADGCRRLAILV